MMENKNDPKSRRKKVTAEQIAIIRKMYKSSTLSMNMIAEQVGVGASTVRNILKKYGDI